MSTDDLTTALRDLVDDAEEGLAAPVADDLWAAGRRRRRTTRLVPALAAACVAALVVLLAWPVGAPRPSVPAIHVDDSGVARLAAYPSVIAKPPVIPATGRPGVTAAVLTEASDPARLYAVTPGGVVTRLVLPDPLPGYAPSPSVSPDGRWLARGLELSDLVRGTTVPSLTVRQGLGSSRMPSDQPAWWSPDSHRVYVDAVNQGRARSSGLVMATDGTITEAPLFAGGQQPVVAGWLDDDTVLAFLQVGTEQAPRLEGRTWRVGDPSWQVAAPDIEWAAGANAFTVASPVRAGLSPDRRRVILSLGAADGAGQLQGTTASVFDVRSGAPVAVPDTPAATPRTSPALFEAVSWDGWGCRPAWHEGAPVITDRTIRTVTPILEPGPVAVSSRYEQPCVSFAGDELRGVPVENRAAVWQERAWVWGTRLLVAAAVGLLAWRVLRRRSWREGSEPPRPFLPARG